MLGMRARSWSSRSHGSSCRKRIDGVERRPAPHLQAEKLRQQMRDGIGDLQQIERAHARGQQRLMRIAHRRIGEQQLLLLAHPLGRIFPAPVPAACSAVPAAGACRSCTAGSTGSGSSRFGSNFPFTSGRPLMITSPR